MVFAWVFAMVFAYIDIIRVAQLERTGFPVQKHPTMPPVLLNKAGRISDCCKPDGQVGWICTVNRDAVRGVCREKRTEGDIRTPCYGKEVY